MAQAAIENAKQEEKNGDSNKNQTKTSYHSFIQCQYTKKRSSIVLKPISSLFESGKNFGNMLEKTYKAGIVEYIESKKTVLFKPHDCEYDFSVDKFCQESSSDVNIEGS